MSKTRKSVFIALSVLAVAAVGNVDAALADAHEQARQLLQPAADTAKRHSTSSMARVAAQDPHEQARRLLIGRDVVANESDTPRALAVATQPRDFVDAHAQASRLLSSSFAAE